MNTPTNFLTSARHSGEGGQKEGSRAEAGSQKENHMLSNVAELVPASKTGKRLSPEETTKIETERMRQWVADRVSACQKEPVLESVTLTPVLARLLLERNTDNRPISEVGLERIKRDIERNHWQFNGEPIIIAKDGQLNDGQHRCRAVVETGVPVRMVIVFGPQRDSRLTLDQGVTRTVGHYLTMLGHTDSNALASVGNNIFSYQNLGYLSTNGRDRATKSECRDLVEETKGIAESLSFVSRKGAAAISSRSTLAFVHWALSRKAGERAANSFMSKLLSGANLPKGSPILYARNRLIEIKGKVNLNEKAEMMFRAFNLWATGETDCKRIPLMGGKLPKIEKVMIALSEEE